MTPRSDFLTADELAAMIRERRQQLGLSQEGLASYVTGLRNTTIANWEGGRYLERHMALLNALEVLGIELHRRDLRLLKTKVDEDEEQPLAR